MSWQTISVLAIPLDRLTNTQSPRCNQSFRRRQDRRSRNLDARKSIGPFNGETYPSFSQTTSIQPGKSSLVQILQGCQQQLTLKSLQNRAEFSIHEIHKCLQRWGAPFGRDSVNLTQSHAVLHRKRASQLNCSPALPELNMTWAKVVA